MATVFTNAPTAPAKPCRSSAAHLVGLAVMLETIYLVMFVMPHHIPLRPISRPLVLSRSDSIGLAVGLGTAFLIYWLAWSRSTQGGDPATNAVVLVASALFSLTMVAMYPITSHDIFAYIVRSHIFVDLHRNPFLIAPASFPGEALYPFLDFPREPMPHGPVWVLIAALPTLITGVAWPAALIAFKLVAWLGYAATTALVYVLLRRVAPNAATAGTLLFAWNPLILFELVGNGHNDGLMAALALGAFVALTSRRTFLAAVLMSLAVLLKFVVLLLAPIVAVWLLRRHTSPSERWRQIALWMGVPSGLAVALYAPFWGGERTFTFLHRGQYLTGSVASILVDVLGHGMGVSAARTVVSGIALAVFAAVYARVWWRVRPDIQGLFNATHDSILWYLLIACLWLQPWYLAWLAPITSLTRGSRRVYLLIGLCLWLEAMALVGYAAFPAP